MKRKGLLLTAVVVALIAAMLSACKPASAPTSAPTQTEKPAPAPIKLKIVYSDYHTAGISVDASRNFVQRLKAITGGEIEPELVLGDTLGSTQETINLVAKGVIHLALRYPAFYAAKMPIASVESGVRGTMQTADEWWSVLYKKGLADILKAEYAKNGVQWVYGWSHTGATQFFRVPVPHISNVKGLRMGVASATTNVYVALGASLVDMPGSELYSAFASGLVDGTSWSTPATNYAMGFHEVAKYWLLSPTTPINVENLLANMDFWKSLPEKYRLAIELLAKEQAAYERQEGVYANNIAITKAKAAGVTMMYWDEADMKKWSETGVASAPKAADAAMEQAYKIVLDYARELGYIK